MVVLAAVATGHSARVLVGLAIKTSTRCLLAWRSLARVTQDGRHKWWGRGRSVGATSCSMVIRWRATQPPPPTSWRNNRNSRGTRDTGRQLGTRHQAGAFYATFHEEMWNILCAEVVFGIGSQAIECKCRPPWEGMLIFLLISFFGKIPNLSLFFVKYLLSTAATVGCHCFF